ncbi:Pr6Pr family membrane protein [Mycoplasmatota bacterium]|nr:Pr6Pr family membrane protein [Mycoplasmatota bacterium]
MKVYLHNTIKVLIIISSGLGVVLNIIQSNMSLYSLTYFTHQSNLFVFLVYLIFLFINHKNHRLFVVVFYQAIVGIVLTAMVYHLMLRPSLMGSSFEANDLVDILVHTLTPILVILERLFFSEKQILKRNYPLMWLAFPFVYYLFTIIYVIAGGIFNRGTEFESRYPYFFLNFEENGIVYFLLVILLILSIGYSMYFLNRKPLIRKRD